MNITQGSSSQRTQTCMPGMFSAVSSCQNDHLPHYFNHNHHHRNDNQHHSDTWPCTLRRTGSKVFTLTLLFLKMNRDLSQMGMMIIIMMVIVILNVNIIIVMIMMIIRILMFMMMMIVMNNHGSYPSMILESWQEAELIKKLVRVPY